MARTTLGDLESRMRMRGRLTPEDPSAPTFNERWSPVDPIPQFEDEIRKRERTPGYVPGYQERYGDPTKVISDLPPSLNAPMERQTSILAPAARIGVAVARPVASALAQAWMRSSAPETAAMAAEAAKKLAGRELLRRMGVGAMTTGAAGELAQPSGQGLTGPEVPPTGERTRAGMGFAPPYSPAPADIPTQEAANVAAARVRQAATPVGGRQMGTFSQALGQRPSMESAFRAMPEGLQQGLLKLFNGPQE